MVLLYAQVPQSERLLKHKKMIDEHATRAPDGRLIRSSSDMDRLRELNKKEYELVQREKR